MSEAAFDFYPCVVDGAPASIYVDLAYADSPVIGADTLYTIALRMRDVGEYGIGTADEAAALNLVEEAVIDRSVIVGALYVGRVRSAGIWEIVLYGPPDQLGPLQAVALERAGDRRIEARSQRDAEWSYYREILLPDAERQQWMDNRRLVQILAEQGDHPSTPRRVDHQLALPAETRAQFVAAAAAAGFVVEEGEGVVRVHRMDAVELEHIHEVVMTLVDLATPLGGTYERWIAGIA